MSGKQVKARRASEIARLEEALLQVHNELHQDEPDMDKLHTVLHEAMGIDDDAVVVVNPLAHVRRFDQRFGSLCRAMSIAATYIAQDPRNPDRLLSGGAAQLTRRVDQVMRRGIDAMRDEQAAIDALMGQVEQHIPGAAEEVAAEFDAEPEVIAKGDGFEVAIAAEFEPAPEPHQFTPGSGAIGALCSRCGLPNGADCHQP